MLSYLQNMVPGKSNRMQLWVLIPILLAGWITGPESANGQYMRLTFEIESELETEELQSFRFGNVVPNIGRINIPLGDPNMGTYAISGMQNLEVGITLDLPDYLELRGEESEYRVPLELEIAYANRNENNVNHAIHVRDRHVRFQLREDTQEQRSPDQPAPHATAFLYVFGDIIVGDIPPGTYEAEVFFEIEYE